MNQRSMLLSLIVATTPAFFTSPAMATVPKVEDEGKAALEVCPTHLDKPTAYHSDKIVFTIRGRLTAAYGHEQEDLNRLVAKYKDADLDIKVRDEPSKVADLEGKVLSFLGASKYNKYNRDNIKITSVEYAVLVCPAKY